MRNNKGSITVEASIIMPIFISIIVSLIMLMRVFLIQSYVDEITSKAARFLSIYSTVDFNTVEELQTNKINKDISLGGILESIQKAYIINIGEDAIVMGALKFCGLNREFLDKYNIQDIVVKNPNLVGDKQDIYVIVKYSIPLNLPLIPIYNIKQESRAVIRSWRNESTQVFWVSDRGAKYHIYGCYHIFKDIEVVEIDDTTILKPCNTCKPQNHLTKEYYKTHTGNKYHIKGCIHLFKDLKEINLYEARNNYEPCKTCIGGKL